MSESQVWCDRRIKKFFGGIFGGASSELEKFRKWENPGLLKRQFCLEFLDGENPPRYASDKVAVTEHFILVSRGLWKKELFLASCFRNLECRQGIYTYWFRDLTTFSLKGGYTEDQKLIKEVIQKYGLVVRARQL